MPTVPAPQGPSIGLKVGSIPAFQNPLSADAATLPGRQLEQTGRAVQHLGGQLTDLFAQRQHEANTLRDNDGRNQYMRTENDLTSNADKTGYADLLGEAALSVDIERTYGEKLRKATGEISASLGNDAQRRSFNAWADEQQIKFTAQVRAHAARQFHVYQDSSTDATIATAGDTILRRFDNHEAVQDSLNAIEGSYAIKARFKGQAPTLAREAARERQSQYLTRVVTSLLDKDDLPNAIKIRDHYQSYFTGGDALDLNLKFSDQFELSDAQQAVSAAATNITQALAPTNIDQLVRITAESESGNRETDAAGKTIVSPKGALGVMQVMPATSADPGFGVRPAGDDSPEERARVGRDYLAAMLTRYNGDPAKTWASYNAGPAAVDAAIKGQGDAWLDAMPAETRAYVAKNMAALTSGGGRPRLKSELEFTEDVVGHLKNPTPKAVEKASQIARQRYALLTKAAEEQEKEDVKAIYGVMQQNGGNYYAVPANLRSRVSPDKTDSFLSFGKSIAEGNRGFATATDPEKHYNLLDMAANDSAAFARIDLNPARQYLSEIDWTALVKKQTAVSKADAKTADIQKVASRAVTAVKADLLAAGIDTSPKPGSQDAKRLAQFNAALYQALDARSEEAGRPLNAKEARDVALGLLTDGFTSRGWFGGGGNKARLFETLAEGDSKVLHVPYARIPVDARNRIIRELKKTKRQPSQTDVENYYGGYLAEQYGSR